MRGDAQRRSGTSSLAKRATTSGGTAGGVEATPPRAGGVEATPPRAGGVEATLARLRSHGARVEYHPGFLSPEEADAALATLLATLVFEPPERSMVQLPFSRRRVPIARRQTAYGEPGTAYRFSGLVVRARPWTEELWALREHLRARTGFAASYESDLGPEPEIHSLSLGAVRDFQLRRKQASPRRGRPAVGADPGTLTLPLAHGSLLVMRHPTNRDWKHQVPRRGGKHAERIGDRLNLTWRRIEPQ
jgi:alkylated DNA repair dioxygenase AlkB